VLSLARLLPILLGALLALPVGAAEAPKASPKTKAKPKPKRKRRPRPAFRAPKEDPDLPRVLLIGDSISIGYTQPVRALLAGKANILRIPANGGPTSRGLQHIDKWLDAGPFDVIHFNWGLHDCRIQWPKDELQIPIEDYEANLKKLVERLKQTDATLIWATTTAVVDGKPGERRKRRLKDVQAYNAVARRIMDDAGIPINDLYAALMSIDESKVATDEEPPAKGKGKAKAKTPPKPMTRQGITTRDGTHFTGKGYQFLAKRVAAAILKALDEQ
jgi:acyl-CoA thioesterase-1